MTGLTPSGNTRVFAVLGDPIAQVLSPAIINRLFCERGADAVLVPAHVLPEDVSEIFAATRKIRNLDGLLVTVPHKQAAFKACASRTARADFVSAVNVMVGTENGWHGDNTDGIGYLDGIEREGLSVAGKRALLVGCGGAGSAIALEILERGAAELAIHDIDTARRDSVISQLDQRFPGKVRIGGTDPSGFDLVANATPLGMRAGDPLPVDVSRLAPDQFVACVVTKPELPPLIEEARKRGCRTMTGAGMFAAQATTLVQFLLPRWTEAKV